MRQSKYSKEFKDSAIQLCMNTDKPVSHIANDLGMSDKTLSLWVREYKKDNKPIVITHASMANVWHLRNDKDNEAIFEEYALWNRINPREDVEIFNIFGHTIQKEVDLTKHYINVDTGCHYIDLGYGKLSAYCIEEDYVVSI